ncbi:hypothetical protein Tco_0838757 [Tanacetum coccineum]|uniref:Uncharacterized protein n=1 Tax=Tanacetum coccineum TaxID=301880 RepID=A0ABQ5ANR8_9ASTR
MGVNAKDSMAGRKHIKGKSGEMNEKAYEMGGNPKDCMGEGKEIRKDNASQMIQKATDQEEQMRNDIKENVYDIKEDTKDETLADKATNMAKGAKDKVVGTMEEAKKTVQGYVDALKPSEENRDKKVDQTDIDVERRPHDEKNYP